MKVWMKILLRVLHYFVLVFWHRNMENYRYFDLEIWKIIVYIPFFWIKNCFAPLLLRPRQCRPEWEWDRRICTFAIPYAVGLWDADTQVRDSIFRVRVLSRWCCVCRYRSCSYYCMLMSAFVWILVLGFVSNASKSKKRARSDNKNTVGDVYRRGSDRLQVK